MIRLLLLFLFIFSTVSSPLFASDDSRRLILGCKQLVYLYENKTNQRAIAQLVMSPSDTLLAGYCKGVIESFVKHLPKRLYECKYNKVCEEEICSKKDWYAVARSVSGKSIASYEYVSVEDIVIKGCN